MKSAAYLEEVKAKLGLSTDKEVADYFNVTKAAISQYKSGARIMENEMCLAVAMTLEIDPLKVIMAADIDRATRSGQHSLWEKIMARGTAVAASTVLATGVTLFLTPQDANARNHGPTSPQERSCLYIM
jgi:transcriptional regulator with XRE-family HTH domain